MKKRGKPFKHHMRGIPMCIKITPNGTSAMETMEFSLRVSTEQLLRGDCKDRAHLDCIGKFIALIRLATHISHRKGSKKEQHTDMLALSILFAEKWRYYEQRFIHTGSLACNAEERAMLLMLCDTGIEYLRGRTDELLRAAWDQIEDQKQVRALLGFDYYTGTPNADDGKLDAYLGMAA